MKTSLLILLMVLTASVVSGQKMSKKPSSPFPSKSFAVLQKEHADSIDRAVSLLRSGRANAERPQYGDNMPNGLKERAQALIYKRNNGRGGSIYQSQMDNMLLVAPDSSYRFNMPTGEYKIIMTPVKP